jgi:hypothetical protein
MNFVDCLQKLRLKVSENQKFYPNSIFSPQNCRMTEKNGYTKRQKNSLGPLIVRTFALADQANFVLRSV